MITKEDLIKFFKKRKEGAKNTASSARAKGGPSMLTYYHFAAKNKPYFEAIEAIKRDKPLSFFEKKFKDALRKINEDEQKKFQELSGIMEVWGECVAKVKEYYK